jgi:hypothetical protein
MPSMVMWGARDRIIPVAHARVAHDGMPGSRLEIFDSAGHFPQLDDPYGFADTLEDFFAQTEPAQLDAESMRDLLVGQAGESAPVLARLGR